MGQHKGEEWMTNQALLTIDLLSDDDYIACLVETKASHKIPHSYRHAMSSNTDRWMIPMQIEMDTLKAKHTWDLVKAPVGVNVMDVGLRHKVGR